MKTKKILLSFLIIIMSVFLTFCSNDEDDNPVAPETKEPAKLEIKEIQLPEHMTQVQDSYAQLAVAFVQMANGFRNYATFFNPPSGATHIPKSSGVQDEWTWQEGTLTIRLVYDENDEMVYWKIYLTGTFEGYTVNNWLGAEAEQTKDGNSGHLKIYEPPTNNLIAEWNWNVGSDGSYSFVFLGYENSQKIEVTVNADNSGILQIYNSVGGQFVLQYKITWTATGSGQWWEYDTAGNVVDQGSWV